MSEQTNSTCVILCREETQPGSLVQKLEAMGYECSLFHGTVQALNWIASNRTDLLIIEDTSFKDMTGPQFINEVMKVSWTTNTILVSSDDAESIHERTEGLGILGGVGSFQDTDGMTRLLG